MGASNEQLEVFQELWCDAFLSAGQPLPGRFLESCGTVDHRASFCSLATACSNIIFILFS